MTENQGTSTILIPDQEYSDADAVIIEIETSA
jgi:hypothetical protein